MKNKAKNDINVVHTKRKSGFEYFKKNIYDSFDVL